MHSPCIRCSRNIAHAFQVEKSSSGTKTPSAQKNKVGAQPRVLTMLRMGTVSILWVGLVRVQGVDRPRIVCMVHNVPVATPIDPQMRVLGVPIGRDLAAETHSSPGYHQDEVKSKGLRCQSKYEHDIWTPEARTQLEREVHSGGKRGATPKWSMSPCFVQVAPGTSRGVV